MTKPELWHPADRLVLEPNALVAACEQHRNLALTAGPGAGKTEMLAQRADFLLRTGLCRYPQRILAISFKVDASRNLKERVRRRCGFALATRFDSHTFHAFAKRLIDKFRPVLTGSNALESEYTIGPQRYARTQITFGDLVPLAIEILTTCAVARNAVRQTYSYVFLDEFQDCTTTQYELIKVAFGDSNSLLTAVGDTKQRIMGWAGALEGIFTTFATNFSAIGLNLYQNFRSAPRLRRMQNAMVKVMEPSAAASEADLQGEEGEIEILSFEDSQQEAETLAALCKKWIEIEGIAPSQIAVLISRQPEPYAQNLMAEFEQTGISYRNEQKLQDLSVEPAARLVIDFLTVILGEREPDAYRRLMDVLMAAAIDDSDIYGLPNQWRQFLDDAREKARQRPITATDIPLLRKLTGLFLTKLGREAQIALSADYEQGGRLDTVIQETFARLTELCHLEADFMKVLLLFAEDTAVRIMTIHKSKGLEFDSVIILGIEQETFWGALEEERSAFFVGISRAKRRLNLTVSKRRPRPAGQGGRWDEARTPHQEFLGYATVAISS